MATARKTQLVRQIWITGSSLVVVALLIFILSLTFGKSNSNSSSSCAPTATPVAGKDGLDGLSAYDLWVASGNTGTKDDFLKSLIGARGPRGYTGSNGVTNSSGLPAVPVTGPSGQPGANGEAGQSAYQLWLNTGQTGTPEDFLASLTGTDGVQGLDGLSAYELWLSNGNDGGLTEFVDSLVGADGAPGQDGKDGAAGEPGLSAYELWVANGNPGRSLDEFLASLKGAPGVCTVGDTGATGAAGASAYEIWLAQGNTGTEQDFLNSLKGASGSGGLPYNGSFFDTTTQTNVAKPNLMRFNTTDPWTIGIRINSANKSRIVFDHPGVYNIQFSSQFAKTDSGTDYIEIWLRKNGQNVPMSNTELRSWGNDDRQVASWNFFVEATQAGDYYELAWQSADQNISILSTAANGTPGIPSVILTVTQVR